MNLVTSEDDEILEAWNLKRFYQNNTSALIEIARIVRNVLDAMGAPTDAANLEPHLTIALQAINIFKSICAYEAPFVAPSVYPVFARALARYILDQKQFFVN